MAWHVKPQKPTKRENLPYNHPLHSRDPQLSSLAVPQPIRLRYRELEPDESVPDLSAFIARLPVLERVLHVSRQYDDEEVRYWFIEPRFVRAARAIYKDSAAFLRGGPPVDLLNQNKRIVVPANGKVQDEPLKDDNQAEDEEGEGWMFVRYFESYEHVPFEEKSCAGFRVYMERRLEEWMDRGY